MSAPLARRSPVRLIRSLLADRRGISVVEFALALPLFLGFCLVGIELANMASVNMRVSQIAINVADNASRLGQTDNSAVTPTVAESDVDSVLLGAVHQAGTLDIQSHGRIVLSSLELDEDSGRQFIHWQRCTGGLARESAYGNDSNQNGLTGDELEGMGKAGRLVTAAAGQAVMYAEFTYEYQPIFVNLFGEVEFKQEAALLVRDDRDLGDGDGLTGTATSDC